MAEHGADGVSMREISVGAGQGNNNAAQYHFRTREGIIEAVLDRRMGPIDERRAADGRRARPGPHARGADARGGRAARRGEPAPPALHRLLRPAAGQSSLQPPRHPRAAANQQLPRRARPDRRSPAGAVARPCAASAGGSAAPSSCTRSPSSSPRPPSSPTRSGTTWSTASWPPACASWRAHELLSAERRSPSVADRRCGCIAGSRWVGGTRSRRRPQSVTTTPGEPTRPRTARGGPRRPADHEEHQGVERRPDQDRGGGELPRRELRGRRRARPPARRDGQAAEGVRRGAPAPAGRLRRLRGRSARLPRTR